MDYITVVFYTRVFANPFVEIRPKNEDGVVCVKMVYEGRIFRNDIVFHREIEWPCQVRASFFYAKLNVSGNKNFTNPKFVWAL